MDTGELVRNPDKLACQSHGCYNRSIMQHVRPEHDPERWHEQNTSAGLDRFWFGHRNNAEDAGWIPREEDDWQPFLFESSDPGSAIAVIRETPIETSLEKLILFNGDIDEKG